MPAVTGTLVTPNLSAAPSSPVKGQLYYDTATNKLFWYNGTSWVDATGGGTPPDATTSTKGIVQLAGDLAGTAASPQIAAGAIVNADVSSSAALDGAKFAVNTILGKKLVWSLGTSPPGGAADGDLWLYQGSGFFWMFVYDSTETTYKWKFVGGPPLQFGKLGGTGTTSTTYIAIPSASLTCPLAGDYDCIFGGRAYCGAAVYWVMYVTVKLGAAAAADTQSTQAAVTNSAANFGVVGFSLQQRFTGRAASDVLALYEKTNGQNVGTDDLWMRLTPVRVG